MENGSPGTPRARASSLTRATFAAMPRRAAPPLVTPDGRYIVVRGRLWRRTNPHLPEATRERHVRELMAARRAVQQARRAGDTAAERAARGRVHAAKVALGERGPVWWTDGAPDYTRHLAHTTPYAPWFATLPASRVSGDTVV